jgi:hypothetical protein
MLTPEEQELLQRHVSIDGDGNVGGDYAYIDQAIFQIAAPTISRERRNCAAMPELDRDCDPEEIERLAKGVQAQP